jgi:uncharacterized protein (DUF1015 family)
MFHPFQVVYYQADKSRQWKDVVSFPYDVMNQKLADEIKNRSPHNFARLDLPDPTAEGYAQSGKLLKQWLDDGILVQERDPAFVLYELGFRVNGVYYNRLGILGAMDVSDYEEGNVLPHERTLAAPKVDRLALMHATKAHLSPIFVMCPDDRSVIQEQWHDWISQGRLLMDVTDDHGFRHVLTLVYSHVIFGELDGMIQRSGQKVMIVDGHHRYESAVQFSKEMTEKHGFGPWNRILTYLTVMQDQDLLCLPTHRVLHSFAGFEGENFRQTLVDEGWIAKPCADLKMLLSTVAETDRREQVFGFALRSPQNTWSWNVLTRKQRKDPDVVVLHEEIFEGLLGMTKEDQNQKKYLRYVNSAPEPDWHSVLSAPDFQALFVLRACAKEEVFSFASQGRYMPQKSTFFYPKILSGTCIYLCNDSMKG